MSDVIALDVSKNHSYAVWYRNNKCLSEFNFQHNKVGFQRLKRIVDEAKSPTVYFEATGIYSRPVARFCQDNQFKYAQLNPLELHLHSENLRRIKTDKVDAHKMAHAVVEKKYRCTNTWSKNYRKLHELSRFYDQISDEIKLKRLRLYTALDQTFPEEEQLFTNQVSKLALNVILLFPHPDLVRSFSRTRLKNKLMSQIDKRLSQAKGLKYAEKLLKFAKISYPAADVDSIQVQEVKYYCRQLIELTKEKDALVKQTEKLAQSLQVYKIYTSIPGIGPLTASRLLGELGDITRFDNANQLNDYIGIDLNRYQSGKYQRQDHINKRGNPHGRALVYIIVRNMIRQKAVANNHIVDYYYRLKKRPIPKRDKVAVVACMNRTLKCLYAMVTAGTEYVYAYADSRSL
ncbi:transposase [Paucilactobacillus hokkaidonensis JCM 18461]|uniref:Transposase n=1 Tax=Paucilactobacillus hokkaidonensis JCM 18461 TaxID=1291742 RepID=A0A0A1GT20_9LACO|nr:IS110 family transposase [Paucilactobacillus hokkaidonensis]BAP85452.1 transposase [Paucilactobacillus hokkaidonensis JCM 18461]